jgi:hypothetical protein
MLPGGEKKNVAARTFQVLLLVLFGAHSPLKAFAYCRA